VLTQAVVHSIISKMLSMKSVEGIEKAAKAEVPSSVVIKALEMDQGDVAEILRLSGVEPLDAQSLLESLFIFCNGELKYLGTYMNGMIEPAPLLRELQNCKDWRISIHTHPVLFPFPSIEDIVNAEQLNIDLECVVSSDGVGGHFYTCLKRRDSWRSLVAAMDSFVNEIILKYVDRYIAAKIGDLIFFVPHPTHEVFNDIFERTIAFYSKVVDVYAGRIM